MGAHSPSVTIPLKVGKKPQVERKQKALRPRCEDRAKSRKGGKLKDRSKKVAVP